jgi:hypothetical protein
MSAHPADVRLARLEGAYEQISDRLNGFDLRFSILESKIDSVRDSLRGEMEQRFDRVDREFRDQRRLIISGSFAVAGFVIVSMILPFLTHSLR